MKYHNFHTKKLGEITVFYAVTVTKSSGTKTLYTVSSHKLLRKLKKQYQSSSNWIKKYFISFIYNLFTVDKNTYDIKEKDVVYDKISHHDRLIEVSNPTEQQHTTYSVLKMKQKDQTDILYEARFLKVCLTDSAATFFWPSHFYGRIGKF